MTVYCAGRRQATAEMPQGGTKRTEEFPKATTTTTTRVATTRAATRAATSEATTLAGIPIAASGVPAAAASVSVAGQVGATGAAAVVLNVCDACCQQQQQQQQQQYQQQQQQQYQQQQQQQQYDDEQLSRVLCCADNDRLAAQQRQRPPFYVTAPAPSATSSSALAYMLMAAATQSPSPARPAGARRVDGEPGVAQKYLADQRRSCWPPPLFIILISLLELAVFVYDNLTVAPPMELDASGTHIPSESVLIYRPDRRLQLWRYVSYMFLHASWLHLGLNVAVQLLYGLPLELVHGTARVAFIYLAGVCAGSLGTSVVDSEVYLVGASGGVYALLAAQVANCLINWGQMRYGRSQLVSVVIVVSCDISYAIYSKWLAWDEARALPGVSYIAHITGALAGFTMGLLVLRHFDARHRQSQLVWWLALGVYAAFTLFAIAFNLLNTMAAQRLEEQGEAMRQHLLRDLGIS